MFPHPSTLVRAALVAAALATPAWSGTVEAAKGPAPASKPAPPSTGAGAGATSAQGACMQATWLDDLWPPLEQVSFRATTLEERGAFARLVPAILEAALTQTVPPKPLVAQAKGVGFELLARTHEGDTVWILREQPLGWHGAGAYVFRTGPASNDVIEAPHAYYDLGTGKLGAAMFSCGAPGHRPRAFLTNTAHRYRSRRGEKKSDADHPADVAHNPDHLFSVVTDLLARHLPAMRLVQVHGFNAADVSQRAGLAAVVSSTRRTPTPWSRQVQARLASVLGDGVRLFPEQTDVLGATQNAQARLLQAYPSTSFVHVELSAESRKALAAPDQVNRLAAALLAPLEE